MKGARVDQGRRVPAFGELPEKREVSVGVGVGIAVAEPRERSPVQTVKERLIALSASDHGGEW